MLKCYLLASEAETRSYYADYWNGQIRFEAVNNTGSMESLTVLQKIDAIIEQGITYDWQKRNCQHFVTAALGLWEPTTLTQRPPGLPIASVRSAIDESCNHADGKQ